MVRSRTRFVVDITVSVRFYQKTIRFPSAAFYFTVCLFEQNCVNRVITVLFPCFYIQDPSEASVLRDMLEFLVSDELRSFQWLVSDHMTGESQTLIDKEQLQRADRPATQRLLETYFGVKQAENIAVNILLKIVPTLGTSS